MRLDIARIEKTPVLETHPPPTHRIRKLCSSDKPICRGSPSDDRKFPVGLPLPPPPPNGKSIINIRTWRTIWRLSFFIIFHCVSSPNPSIIPLRRVIAKRSICLHAFIYVLSEKHVPRRARRSFVMSTFVIPAIRGEPILIGGNDRNDSIEYERSKHYDKCRVLNTNEACQAA